MSIYEVESIFDDFERGRIDEYNVKSSLHRINNSSCVSNEVDRIIRNTDIYDSYDCARKFNDAIEKCRMRNREREEREREDREYYGY